VGNGRTECRHDRVATKLLDEPVIAGHASSECFEKRILEGAHVLRVETLGQGAETRNVGENDSDLSAVRLGMEGICRSGSALCFCGKSADNFSRRGARRGRSTGRLSQAAPGTKGEAGQELGTAAGAHHGEI
jgi:hypothetical protein